MYCPHCGTQNADTAYSCIACHQPLNQFHQPKPSIPNYLVQAILVTVFCCLPFGIVAIVYAAQVNGKIQAGDYAGAGAASRSAKTWCWTSFGCGLAFGLFYILAMIFGLMSEFSRW